MRSSKILPMFLVFLLCGCQSIQSTNGNAHAANVPEANNANLLIRNNALALLNDLMNDEKNLSKVLIVKHNSDELGKLVKTISETAGNAAKLLEEYSKSDGGIDFKRLDLPPGEAATRKLIAKTKEHELLSSKDAEFEFQLLLTQVEALNYGAHLAMVIADSEKDPSRTREFLRLGSELRDLRERVEAMLRRHK